MQTGCNGVSSLIAGRVLNGVTVGITSSQVPVYLGEIARKEKRGSLIIIQQLAIGTLLNLPSFTRPVMACSVASLVQPRLVRLPPLFNH